MLQFKESRDIEISGVYFLSSPRYSINFADCADIVVHDITIFIDSSMNRGPHDRESITYALNTDGIDIAAFNVTIYNTNITNYDDAIVPKPCRTTGKYCTCSGNIYAYNNYVHYGVGLSIGSVPPNDNVNWYNFYSQYCQYFSVNFLFSLLYLNVSMCNSSLFLMF